MASYELNKNLYIGDIDMQLKDIKDFIIARYVDTNCRVYTSVTADVPTGYKFLCWLQPASYGTVKGAYMEIYDHQTTNIWVVDSDSNLRHSFHCPYLCIRNI